MTDTLKIELWEPGNKEIEMVLQARGVEKELWGVVKAAHEGEYTVRVKVDHRESQTKGRVVIRGVVSGGARLKLSGEVVINKGVVGAEDTLDFKLIVLDDRSKAEVVPQMEIAANQVMARHACSVGRIDAKELYYLMSRGLSREESEELIVQGFLQVVTDKIREVN